MAMKAWICLYYSLQKEWIHLQRKIVGISHQEEERLESQGMPEEEIERKRVITDRVITMEWVGANPGGATPGRR